MLSSAQAYSDLLQQLGDTDDRHSPSTATEGIYLIHSLLHGLYYAKMEKQIHLSDLGLFRTRSKHPLSIKWIINFTLFRKCHWFQWASSISLEHIQQVFSCCCTGFSCFFLSGYVKFVQTYGVDRIKKQESRALKYCSCFPSVLKVKLVCCRISGWSRTNGEYL